MGKVYLVSIIEASCLGLLIWLIALFFPQEVSFSLLVGNVVLNPLMAFGVFFLVKKILGSKFGVSWVVGLSGIMSLRGILEANGVQNSWLSFFILVLIFFLGAYIFRRFNRESGLLMEDEF